MMKSLQSKISKNFLFNR